MKHAAAIELIESTAGFCEHNAAIYQKSGEKKSAEYNEQRARELRESAKALQS